MSSLYDEFLSQERFDDLPAEMVLASYRQTYLDELERCRHDYIVVRDRFSFVQSLLVTYRDVSPLDGIVLDMEDSLSDLRCSYLRMLVVFKLICAQLGGMRSSDTDVFDLSFMD